MIRSLIKPARFFNAEQAGQNLDGELKRSSRSYTQAEIKALLFPKEISPEGVYEKIAAAFSLARNPRDIFNFSHVTAGPKIGDPAVICSGGLYCGGFVINLGWGRRVERENRFTYQKDDKIAKFEDYGDSIMSVRFGVPAPNRLTISDVNFFWCRKIEPKTDDEKEQALIKMGRIARQVFKDAIPNLPALQLQMIEAHVKAGGSYAPEAKKLTEAAAVRFSTLTGSAIVAESILKLK